MRRLWYLVAGGYAAWRLGELWLSKKHERRLADLGLPRQRARGFGWMLAAHVAPFALGPVEVARRRRPPPAALTFASACALGLAAATRVWVQRTLGTRWNVHVHAHPGMAVATDGPYQYVRHPNYSAVILELAALPLLGGAFATAAVSSLLNAVALSYRIADEERALSESMTWRVLMADKPRFLPGLV